MITFFVNCYSATAGYCVIFMLRFKVNGSVTEDIPVSDCLLGLLFAL